MPASSSRAYSQSIANELQGSQIMLKWALIFALVAIVASILGFSSIAAGAAGVSKFLLLLVVIGVLLVIGVGVLGYRALR